jgi:NAD(P)-dependent dehydrogenase (short-subunit alcohol dehydrogenase family)
MAEWEGKIGLVTGGSSGIGFAIARELLERGATVVITGHDEAEVAEAVTSLGSNCWGRRADVSNLAEMTALYADVIARHGRLDTVVANAGIGDHGPLATVTEAQFDNTFDVNVKGVVFTVQPAIPLMTNGGTVVIIGSTASIQPPMNMSLYGGAKAAIRSFVRSWIQEIKGTAIRINVLSPGATDTLSLRRALAQAHGEEGVPAAVRAMGEQNPLGRLADPREIAKAVLFLAGDESSYITGVELFADAGLAQVG